MEPTPIGKGPPMTERIIVQSAPSPGTAAALEVVFGLVLQTFGIGWISSGRVLFGLLVMFGYWTALGINILLSFVGVGLITGPCCWVLMLVASPVLAAYLCPRPRHDG